VPLDATFTYGYFRLGYSDSTRGVWAQLTAASLGLKEEPLAGDSIEINDSTKVAAGETAVSHPQYIGAAGWSRGALSLSATARLRVLGHENYLTPQLRAGWDTPRASVSLFGEQRPDTRVRRIEASGRLVPLSFLSIAGAVSRRGPTLGTAIPSTLAWRGELGLRVHRAWLTVGRVSRDTADLIAPIVFDTGFRGASVGAAAGTTIGLRGRVWKDVGLDVSAIKWDSAGPWLPQYETRSQLYVNTAWRRRFPTGNFNFLAAITHEYRTAAYFPIDNAVLASSQYRAWGFLLEIRLLTATLTYQYRNLLNEEYTQVPGFLMPRPAQLYGIRWQFFN
jgi:hypothetical protein